MTLPFHNRYVLINFYLSLSPFKVISKLFKVFRDFCPFLDLAWYLNFKVLVIHGSKTLVIKITIWRGFCTPSLIFDKTLLDIPLKSFSNATFSLCHLRRLVYSRDCHYVICTNLIVQTFLILWLFGSP